MLEWRHARSDAKSKVLLTGVLLAPGLITKIASEK
jgi:hypothetical protein